MSVSSENSKAVVHNWYHYLPNSTPNSENVAPTEFRILSHLDSTHEPKRIQVPKACLNCRKMHSACNVERPCQRCIHNGLSDTCKDAPRKKRSKKQNGHSNPQTPVQKLLKNESLEPKIPSIPQSTIVAQKELETLHVESPSKLWENFESNLSQSGSSSDSSPPLPHELIDSPFDLSSLLGNNSMSNLGLELPNPPPGDDVISALSKQIENLQFTNQNLQRSLESVTKELIETKKEKHLELVKNQNSRWYSFDVEDSFVFKRNPNLAVSVWKSVGPNEKTLVECNENFVKLLGYPMSVLKNFTCRNMVPISSICPNSNYEENEKINFPMKTKIFTSQGEKEVYISIKDIRDHNNFVNYYIVELLDPIYLP